MGTELNGLEGIYKARRSIMAVLLSLALFAIAVTFIVDGALRAVTIAAAAAAAVSAFRGLPKALVEYAGQRRGSTYVKAMSIIIPIIVVLLSIYVTWLLFQVQASDLIRDMQLGLTLALVVIAGLVNLVALAFNIFSSD